VNGPNSIKISQYANSASTRKTMYIHYNNRAYPKNIQALDSLLFYRQRLAETLGFKSYAEYALVDKMAKSPEKVWAFEKDLQAKLTPLVTKDLSELRGIKKNLFPGEFDTVYAWDISYLTKQLLDSKYQLNTDSVKEYFEMNNTIAGMFAVYKKILNIDVKETKDIPTWYSKVKTFEMWKDGNKIGSFYFDLYPRMNKYTHFACFPISQYSKMNGKEALPVSALICNFPEGTDKTPSLLNHSDVITLFHEFGHLVHSMLGRSDLASQGPFYVKGDFVEAPSQFLENWCWEYESLKMFAKNYKNGAPLPESMFKKMKAAQMVNSGINNMRQVYLGTVDFTFEDKYGETQKAGAFETSKSLFAINQVPFPEGSHFICSFTHLSGYAANYYGYLWSKVFAQDMFFMFQKNGVMDSATGLRYRKEVLESAATTEEMDKLRTFLGREPNSDAFMKFIGVMN
jgi:thimet oligopeptidase